MMKKYRTGLVVGKFCPLHKGHEYVITMAAQQCDQVIILSYTSSNFPHCSAENRKKWLENFVNKPSLTDISSRFRIEVLNPDNVIFPDDNAPDEDHRQFCAQYLVDTLETTVQTVFTSEEYGQGFADYLSKYFTKRFPKPVTVDHVMVDNNRVDFPISGTQLRDYNVSSEMEKFTSEYVRSFFLKKILFLGGESSGKTTLCKQLANHFGTIRVPEFGRVWYDSRGGVLQYEDMEYIAKTQLIEEESRAYAQSAWYSSPYLFCDTSALTTTFYSEEWFGRVSLGLEEMYWDSFERYDIVYVCAPDFPMVQDGTRQDEDFRQKGYRFVIGHLESAGITYTILTGTEQQRLAKVIGDLNE